MDNPDEYQHNGKRKIRYLWWFPEWLPCDKDKDGCNEKDGAKASEKICHSLLEPPRWRLGWDIESDLLELRSRLFSRQALQRRA